MSDNYTQLSTLFDVKDTQKVLDVLDTLSNLEDMEESESNCLTDDWITLRTSIEDGGNPPDFSIVKGVGDSPDSLWVCSEETCNLEAAALILQKLLQEEAIEPNHPKGALVNWADTCSRPKVDEFGGSAFLVTADSVKWMPSSFDWAMTQGV